MSSPSELAAAGPRTRARAEEYRELLELILEGSRLHYDEPGAPRSDDQADLDLLTGDQRYAQGLVALAELGDLEAVAELADLISLVAQAGAAGDDSLRAAAWSAAAVAIGWGPTATHAAAKRLARQGDPGAASALRDAALTAR